MAMRHPAALRAMSLSSYSPRNERFAKARSARMQAIVVMQIKVDSQREVLGIGDGDKTAHRGTLAFLPSFHVIGFTNNFLYNLYAGVRCMVHADLHNTSSGRYYCARVRN